MKYKKYITEARKYSNEDLINIIDNEGIGYAIQQYLSYKNIEDKEVAKWWKIASDAMDKITSLIGY